MSKLIILMDATLDQLQLVESIDNEMAIQIREVRDASHFIDFNTVSGITGVPKSTLKKYFIEPGMLFFYQKIHNDLVSFRQEIKQDLSIITSGLQSIITSGLQEEDKTMAEVDKTEETTGTSGIRLTEMETRQLIKSTTQFQNHIPLLQHEHREIPEKLDTLIKHKNQQVEEQYETQPKCLSTPASSTPYQDFCVVSPISKSTSYFMNKDIMRNPCASAETTLKIDTAPRVVKQKHEKPNIEVSVDQGPLAPPMDTPYTGHAQSDTTFTIQTQFDMSTIGQGPLAPPVSLYDADHYITGTHETKLNYLVLPGYPGLGTMVPSSEYYPISVEDCPAPKLSPNWSCSNLLPRVQHIVGSAVSTAPAFYSGSIKNTPNITAISLQLTTSIVMSSHVQSVDNTYVKTNCELTPDRHKWRERKCCHRESSSASSEDSYDRQPSQLKQSYARGGNMSPQPLKVPIFTISFNISLEYFLQERQKEVTRRIVEANHSAISGALKWTKSSLPTEKASYGASMTYASSHQSYFQRQVKMSYINDSDHCPQRPTASLNSQTFEKMVEEFEKDVTHLISSLSGTEYIVPENLSDGKGIEYLQTFINILQP